MSRRTILRFRAPDGLADNPRRDCRPHQCQARTRSPPGDHAPAGGRRRNRPAGIRRRSHGRQDRVRLLRRPMSARTARRAATLRLFPSAARLWLRAGRRLFRRHRGQRLAASRLSAVPKEVEWSIACDCGCENHEWSHLSDVLGKAERDRGRRSAGTRRTVRGRHSPPPGTPPGRAGAKLCKRRVEHPAAGDGQETGQGEKQAAKKPKRKRKTDPSHRGTRQPRKAPSRFLMANMWHLDNIYNFEHLFDGYCHVYEDSEGHLPSNPRASFLEAAYSCAERILRMRGLNG